MIRAIYKEGSPCLPKEGSPCLPKEGSLCLQCGQCGTRRHRRRRLRPCPAAAASQARRPAHRTKHVMAAAELVEVAGAAVRSRALPRRAVPEAEVIRAIMLEGSSCLPRGQ